MLSSDYKPVKIKCHILRSGAQNTGEYSEKMDYSDDGISR